MCLKEDRKISKTEHKQACIVYINLLQLNNAIYVPLLSGTGGSRGLLKNEEHRWRGHTFETWVWSILRKEMSCLKKKRGWGAAEVDWEMCRETWNQHDHGLQERTAKESCITPEEMIGASSLHGPLPLSTPLCLSAAATVHLTESPLRVVICMLWQLLSLPNMAAHMLILLARREKYISPPPYLTCLQTGRVGKTIKGKMQVVAKIRFLIVTLQVYLQMV